MYIFQKVQVILNILIWENFCLYFQVFGGGQGGGKELHKEGPPSLR